VSLASKFYHSKELRCNTEITDVLSPGRSIRNYQDHPIEEDRMLGGWPP